MLSRVRLSSCEDVIHFDIADRRAWQDFAVYGAKVLTASDLEDMYELAEERWDWTVPGRDMTLPQQCWDFLDENRD